MPSMRRMRVSGFVIFAVFLYILYISSTTRHSRDPDFYTRTKTALASSDRDKSSQLPKQQGQQQILQPIDPSRKTSSNGQDEAVAVAMAQRLKDAENVAKDNANAKAPTRESVMGDEKAKNTVEDLGSGGKDRNVAGRKKVPVDDVVKEQKTPEQLAEEKEVEADLNGFFKRSPIIIFSKSYCPHSKRAKDILLDKYLITPAPFVVELDLHTHGPQLQARLGEMTGRKTVPNVMINGKSIGGGDDIAALDSGGTLVETVREMGGKQMQDVKLRPQVEEGL